MKILNDEGQIIGECEIVDQTKDVICCKSVVLELTASCPEVKKMSFAFDEADGEYRITNVPVFFSNKEKTIMATYNISSGNTPAGGYVLFEKA